MDLLNRSSRARAGSRTGRGRGERAEKTTLEDLEIFQVLILRI